MTTGINKYGKLDEASKDGRYTIPRPKKEQGYDLRALSKFVRKMGIDTAKLTDEELKKFESPKHAQ